MYKKNKVCIVVPAHNEEEFVGGVIKTVPAYADWVVVVDDASTDGTSNAAAKAAGQKVFILKHEKNQGVGGAIIAGHKKALELGADFSVVMAGDGQMPSEHAHKLLDALVEGYDYAKGNRFLSKSSIQAMPLLRLLGNIILTFLTKAASGYWQIFDPQNGFTAIRASALRAINLDSVSKGYLFENDMLVKLNIAGLRVKDVAIPSSYGSEKSGIKLRRFAPAAAFLLGKSFFKRIFEKYVIRDFHPIALFFIFGLLLLTLGLATGAWILWNKFFHALSPSVGSVLLCLLPSIVGVQLLLTALILDVLETKR